MSLLAALTLEADRKHKAMQRAADICQGLVGTPDFEASFKELEAAAAEFALADCAVRERLNELS